MIDIENNSGTIDIASYKVSDIHNIRMENLFVNLNEEGKILICY